MDQVWFTAALWFALALLATLLGTWLHVSVALTEIVVGVAAQVLLDALGRSHALTSQEGWVTFLAGAGSVVLTFLAGAELEPEAFRRRWRESTALGLVGFAAPFLGAAWAARFLLGWDPRASWLAGVALSTTSVAVVYAVLLELGLNRTEFGKVILSACFINDLGTVIALGLLFAPFTARTAVFVAALVTGIITRSQYSLLVAVVIASAVIPTWVANRFFLPHHHVERAQEVQAAPAFGGE